MTSTTATPTEELIPPKEPRQWSLAQIERVLSRPIPDSMLRTKEIKGNKITYIPWFEANRILSKYCPGWAFELTQFEISRDVPEGNRRSHRVFVVGRLTIPTAEGNCYREASGTELLKDTNRNGEQKEIANGDPSSNAESMAFRRCCAGFGLGLYLYDK